MIIYFTVFCDRFNFSFEFFESFECASHIYTYIIDNHSYGTVKLCSCRVDSDSWYTCSLEDQYYIILDNYLNHKFKLNDCRFLGDFYSSLCDSLDNDVDQEEDLVFFTEDEVDK